MMEGIQTYLSQTGVSATICASDIKDRGYENNMINSLQYGKDFLMDDYEDTLPIEIDYIIMNPPYSLIEPFVMKSLSIAEKGILMLGRLQFLEGKGRYENILKDNPPTDVYIYVNRIKCYKNGDESDTTSSAQAYAWFYWNLEKINSHKPYIHWIQRAE